MKKNEITSYETAERKLKQTILPRLAGLPHKRTRIGAHMMTFLADKGHFYFAMYPDLCEIIYEIGLQRISCGPVMHPDDRLHTFTALPVAYRKYGSLPGSKGCYPERMDKADEDFLHHCLDECCQLPKTRTHALAICFGLIRYLTPKGNILGHYELGTPKYQPNASALYWLAYRLVKQYATDKEIFAHWATPRQWNRHYEYFAKLAQAKQLNWKNFFNMTNLFDDCNFIGRIQKERQFKKTMLAYNLTS